MLRETNLGGRFDNFRGNWATKVAAPDCEVRPAADWTNLRVTLRRVVPKSLGCELVFEGDSSLR